MIRVSNGNKKIGNDTLIINMCSATDCPSRSKGLCQVSDRCYAMKAEKQYPAVLPYRREQEVYWGTNSSSEIARDLKGIIERKRHPIKYVRFSESGDFSAQRDVDKLKGVARNMPDVVFYGYTARRDLEYNDIPNNLIINGSGFIVSNSFTAVDRILEEHTSCPGDCRECNLCKDARGIEIKVLYH